MSHEIFDVVVVGAGIEGSSTAHYLASRNAKTLLLEQFPLPHSRGSSHGQSRITRKAYDKDFYTEMMQEATGMWLELQNKCGVEIYKRCGFLSLGKSGDGHLTATLDNLKRFNCPHQTFNPEELKNRFPMLSYPDSYIGVLDFDGGILMADRALRAYQSEFVKSGGRLVDEAKVLGIDHGAVVTLTTTQGEYRARKVVLTLGAWAPNFLKPLGLNLPLQPVRITVFYWKEKEFGSHSAAKLPTFFADHCVGPYDVYGLPSEEYPGHVKICLHHGPAIDPDERDKSVDSTWVSDLITDYVRRHFPYLETSAPTVTETCIYTNTPDKNPILDTHPLMKNIVVGAGFSGHGFKFAPVVGKILGQLALGDQLTYDVKPFRISRFQTTSQL